MPSKKVLIIGLGEVGLAMYNIVRGAGYRVYGYDIDSARTINKLEEIEIPVNIMHICYPYTESFVQTAVTYIKRFKPELVLIESTVPPGTTEEIYSRVGVDVAHSPIRGKHPHLEKHIKFWTKWVGPTTPEAGRKAKEYYESLGLKVRIARSSRETELAKLIETTYRALLIAWWQEMHRMAKTFNASIAEVAEFIAEVHRVLNDRPVYYPDFIGGHCLIPNTYIMRKVYSSPIWDFIIESNKKRAKEILDPEISKEIQALRKIWLRLTSEWYYK